MIFRPEEAAGDLAAAIETGIIQFHQNFLLGPANEVLDGHAMLVDTASQYGVGTHLPAGRPGSRSRRSATARSGCSTGAMTALWFAAGYARPAAGRHVAPARRGGARGRGRRAGLQPRSIRSARCPSTGPLRFGMPMALIARRGRGRALAAPRARAARARGARGRRAVASIWSLEALRRTRVAVFAAHRRAAGVARAGAGPAARGWRRGARRGARAASPPTCCSPRATLAARRRAARLGRSTSPTCARSCSATSATSPTTSPAGRRASRVGAAYLASAVGDRRAGAPPRPAGASASAPALIALTGVTAYGIALFSYFVDRSPGPHPPLRLRCRPCSPARSGSRLLLRAAPRVSRAGADRRPRRGARGRRARSSRSPGPRSATASRTRRSRTPRPAAARCATALDRLWHPPPLDPGAAGRRARCSTRTCRASDESLRDRHRPTSASRS